jgi:t-SNARE complex subunit (syntaxin)
MAGDTLNGCKICGNESLSAQAPPHLHLWISLPCRTVLAKVPVVVVIVVVALIVVVVILVVVVVVLFLAVQRAFSRGCVAAMIWM